MIRIKRVTVLDLVAFTNLAETYWKEAEKGKQPLAMGKGSFNRETFMDRAGYCLIDKNQLILAAEDEETGDLIGFFWLHVIHSLWSDEYYASEQYYFVKEEHRKTRAPYLLLDTAKRITELAGCNFLQVANLTESEALERVYKKRGTRLGTCYIFPFK